VVSLFILAPLLAIFALNFMFRRLGRFAAFWVGLLFSLAQIELVLLPRLPFWTNSNFILNDVFRFSLGVDNFTKLILLSSGVVLAVVFVITKALIDDEAKRFDFFNLLFIIMIGINGVALTKDLFSLYVFIEVTSITSFILIAFDRNMHAFEAAFKYIMLSALASVLMLSGMSLLLLVCGATGFSAVAQSLAASPNNFTVFAVGLFLCGLFIKSGLAPFHTWLPDSYSSAPAPVSVLLAGIVTKTAGVYALMRVVVSIFGFSPSMKLVLLFVGAFSAVLGALAALTQSDIKRMLAYSSISQVGYIVLGLGSGSALGVAGAALHLFNHSVFKSLLFVNAAAVETQSGTRDLDKMSGLAQKMPYTGITSCLASLSAAGLPPLAGFWSKLMIIMALWGAGFRMYSVIAAATGVLTLAYFLSLQRRAFFGEVSEKHLGVKEAGLGLVLPSVVLGALVVLTGVLTPFILKSVILPLGNILGG